MLENPYDSLDPILQDYYNKYVKIDEEKERFIVQNLNQEIGKIIDKLKNTGDLQFNQYYQEIVYTGSYWDRVKVKLADEFDVNLVFKLPGGIRADAGYPPGHTYLKLAQIPRTYRPYYRSNRGTAYHRHRREFFPVFETVHLTQAEAQETYSGISRWTDDNLISPAKFLSWMEGVFAKAGIITQQSVSKSGPALTVTMKFDKRVTVDFTPVFILMQIDPREERCFAVPKPHPKWRNTWRISICEREKNMFENKRFLKIILKLVKKVRDNLEMPKLSSYYIKTLFLREVSQSHIDWSVHIGRLFMHMMEKLEYALAKRTIPSIVDQRLNILELSLDTATIDNMHGRIKRFNNEMKMILNRHEDNFSRIIREKLGEF